MHIMDWQVIKQKIERAFRPLTLWRYRITNQTDIDHYEWLRQYCGDDEDLNNAIFGWPYRWVNDYDEQLDQLILRICDSYEDDKRFGRFFDISVIATNNRDESSRWVALRYKTKIFVLTIGSLPDIRFVRYGRYDPDTQNDCMLKNEVWSNKTFMYDVKGSYGPCVSRYATIRLWQILDKIAPRLRNDEKLFKQFIIE